jgi:F0F1-type ATP synthase, alpha subunit
MSVLNIDAKAISDSLNSTLGDWKDSVKDDVVGYVSPIADGVARVKGLENVMASELLEFPGGLFGVALILEEDSIGVVLMGDSNHLEEGNPLKQTGEVLSFGVVVGFLGRVFFPLRNPIDGYVPLEFSE